MYRVVIVEDDPMVSLLDRTYTEKDARFQVVQTFQNGQAALEWLSVNPRGSGDPGRVYAAFDGT